MQPSIEYFLLVIAVLIIVSILANKVSGRLGVPALLIFLLVGMLAGSEGPGGIYFDDPWVAQAVGVIALTYSSSQEASIPAGVNDAKTLFPFTISCQEGSRELLKNSSYGDPNIFLPHSLDFIICFRCWSSTGTRIFSISSCTLLKTGPMSM